jgi:hypothetical protein
VSGANIASPGVGTATDPDAAAAAAAGATAARPADPIGPSPPVSPAERPEVQAGAAFVGAFLVARILKRVFD